jgi:small subunit ribosomal protein S5
MSINPEEVGELVDKVVFINRVAKVVKAAGGSRSRRSSSSAPERSRGRRAGQGQRGAGGDPQRSTDRAKRNLFRIPLIRARPHEIMGEFGAASVLIRRPPQYRVIAGGGVPPGARVAGVTDI